MVRRDLDHSRRVANLEIDGTLRFLVRRINRVAPQQGWFVDCLGYFVEGELYLDILFTSVFERYSELLLARYVFDSQRNVLILQKTRL